jgi:DNA-binding MarR family transcriptional regulator
MWSIKPASRAIARLQHVCPCTACLTRNVATLGGAHCRNVADFSGVLAYNGFSRTVCLDTGCDNTYITVMRTKKRTLRQQAHIGLIRAGALLRDDMELMLKPHGLTEQQYNVLRILRGAEPEGLCRNDIRDRMLNRMSDMTRLLDRLEAAGLVERFRVGDDRRMVMTRITAQGDAVLAGIDDQADREQERRLQSLSDEQVAALLELVKAVEGNP